MGGTYNWKIKIVMKIWNDFERKMWSKFFKKKMYLNLKNTFDESCNFFLKNWAKQETRFKKIIEKCKALRLVDVNYIIFRSYKAVNSGCIGKQWKNFLWNKKQLLCHVTSEFIFVNAKSTQFDRRVHVSECEQAEKMTKFLFSPAAAAFQWDLWRRQQALVRLP